MIGSQLGFLVDMRKSRNVSQPMVSPDPGSGHSITTGQVVPRNPEIVRHGVNASTTSALQPSIHCFHWHTGFHVLLIDFGDGGVLSIGVPNTVKENVSMVHDLK